MPRVRGANSIKGVILKLGHDQKSRPSTGEFALFANSPENDCSLTTMTSNPHQLAAEIKQFARQIGFDLVGIASAEPSHYRDYLRQWLDDGNAGTMDYLQARFAERVDPQ